MGTPDICHEYRASPLPTFQSALLRYPFLLTGPLFNVIYGFLERHGLRIPILRQNRKTQYPTNNVSLQYRGLDDHCGDARQDV